MSRYIVVNENALIKKNLQRIMFYEKLNNIYNFKSYLYTDFNYLETANIFNVLEH